MCVCVHVCVCVSVIVDVEWSGVNLSSVVLTERENSHIHSCLMACLTCKSDDSYTISLSGKGIFMSPLTATLVLIFSHLQAPYFDLQKGCHCLESKYHL